MTLDTSVIFALVNRKDPDHTRVRTVLSTHQPPYIVATAAMAEIAYLIETRLGFHILEAFLSDIEKGLFRLDFILDDIPRAKQLARQFQNLPLGLTDALVIACAERSGGSVMSLDEHFWIGSGQGTIVVENL